MPERLYSTTDVAELLKVDRQVVGNWWVRQNGILPKHNFEGRGGQPLWRWKTLVGSEALIERGLTPPP